MTSDPAAIIQYLMQLVVNPLPAIPTPWRDPDVALRVRPGERPVWVRLMATTEELDRLRATAAAARLPIDVLVAVLIEWQLCRELAAELYEDLRHDAQHALGEARLAPDEDLRAWDRLLAGKGPDSAIDELPEVALPQRLAARISKVPKFSEVGDLTAAAGAIEFERAATREGMGMEAWVARRLLAAVSGVPAPTGPTATGYQAPGERR